ncbi:hypothetical protein JHD48_05090 [Sulfurimonas sp. SAG-AH-194-I05]|nr:multiheme c-type cytochrome [Sulfurimonas sp. SAG-AH-194-I05]MDF1875101.1 hypothetical protein [Sulfurimonas sp. SAG-AH-194-I05]
MKFKYLLTLLCGTFLVANSSFAPNSDCKKCHPDIYKEYETSMHRKSTVFLDPIHKAIWDKHPLKSKKEQYKCAKCHTPTANNLSDMLGKDTKGIPDIENSTHTEGILCTYCHRIESVQYGNKSNTNKISQDKEYYFGNIRGKQRNTFHSSTNDNTHFMNGGVCMGCHSHKKNKKNLDVCITGSKNENSKENCITCHMPKVTGDISTKRDTLRHSFHGFPGTNSNQDMLAKYIHIHMKNDAEKFHISIYNESPHDMLLHPLRLTKLLVRVEHNKIVKDLKQTVFARTIGRDTTPLPPWLASEVIKNTMIKADETRVITYKKALKKGDKVTVTLGYYLVNPKLLKKFGLEKEGNAGTFKILKQHIFTVK